MQKLSVFICFLFCSAVHAQTKLSNHLVFESEVSTLIGSSNVSASIDEGPNYYLTAKLGVGYLLQTPKLKFSLGANVNLFYSKSNKELGTQKYKGQLIGFQYQLSYYLWQFPKLKFGIMNEGKMLWQYYRYREYFDFGYNTQAISISTSIEKKNPSYYLFLGPKLEFNLFQNCNLSLYIGCTFEASKNFSNVYVNGLEWWFNSGVQLTYYLPGRISKD